MEEEEEGENDAVAGEKISGAGATGFTTVATEQTD